jgi:hypothetical protein
MALLLEDFLKLELIMFGELGLFYKTLSFVIIVDMGTPIWGDL